MYRRTTSLIARRALTIAGSPVAAGARLTHAQMRSIRRIDSLVSNGDVQAGPETYGRRGRFGPEPTYVTPGLRNILSISAVQSEDVEMAQVFTVLPEGTYVFDFGDESATVADPNGIISHTFNDPGVYTVSAQADLQKIEIDVRVVKLNATVDLLDPMTFDIAVTPPASGPVSFIFGDSDAEPTVDADGAISYTYTEAGIYTVIADTPYGRVTAEVRPSEGPE